MTQAYDPAGAPAEPVQGAAAGDHIPSTEQPDPPGSQYAAPTTNELAAILEASMKRAPEPAPQDNGIADEPMAAPIEDAAPAPEQLAVDAAQTEPAIAPEQHPPAEQTLPEPQQVEAFPHVEHPQDFEPSQQPEEPQQAVQPEAYVAMQPAEMPEPAGMTEPAAMPEPVEGSEQVAMPESEATPEPATVPEQAVAPEPPVEPEAYEQPEPSAASQTFAPQEVDLGLDYHETAVSEPADPIELQDVAPPVEYPVDESSPDTGGAAPEVAPDIAAAEPDVAPDIAAAEPAPMAEIETDIAPLPPVQPGHEDKPVGTVISISGSKATVLLNKSATVQGSAEQMCPHIGTVLTVDTGVAVVLCLITGMSVPSSAVEKDQTDTRIVEVDLVGELIREQDGYLRTLRRGCSVYPKLGDPLFVASHLVLEKAYHFNAFNSVEIGTIHQDPSIPAVIKVDDMLGKHFAIVGSTGSGKSCTVALILRQVLSRHPNAHVVLLDPHNEYDSCFGKASEIVRLNDLSLPFWFLNFEELVEILIGNAKDRAEEVEILRDVIPFAKRQFGEKRDQSAAVMLQRSVGNREKYTVDVPVPYRISDVLRLIDTQMGRLENRRELSPFKRLKARIETISQDPRYEFMFGSLTVKDNLADILKRLFRIPVAGKPITVIQLMGLPAEIVNVVVSVLARLAFDLALWSDGKMPITFVCEEAHRYVPRDTGLGFEPTKRAISRIAKEGRKYGVSLCVVSQRPGDLDPTILSQCSTLFTMRLSNERDQDIIRSALPDAAESLIDFLPSLGTRETIVFGEGVTLPSHILLSELPENTLPKGNSSGFTDAWSADISDASFVDEVVSRWRVIGQLPDDGSEDPSPEPEAPEPLQPVDTASQPVDSAPQPAPAQNGAANGHHPDPALQAAQNGAAPQQPAEQAIPAQAAPQPTAPAPAAQPAPSPEAMPVFPEIPPLPEMPPLRPSAPQPQAAAPIAQPRAPVPTPAAPSQSTNSTIAEALAERFKKLNF